VAYPAVILDLDTHELIKFDSKETETSVKLIELDQHTTTTLKEVKKMEITSTDIRSFKSGLIFIVKTLDEKFYKFQVISLDKEKNALKFQYEIIE